MNLDLANLVGLAGSALMVFAYAYSNMARQLNFLIFNLLNLVGSLLLIWSLTVHFNMASMALEKARNDAHLYAVEDELDRCQAR